jgi:ferritin-like metal-binding protein YciE
VKTTLANIGVDLDRAAHGSALSLANHLEHADVVSLLQETLDEESAADEKLSSISLEEILPNAEVADQAEV